MSTSTKHRWDHGPLRWALRSTARVTSAAEAVLFGPKPPNLPPLFIVGWPRAGTTLIYQSICHAFDVSFPTRACDKLPVAGAVATRLTMKRGIDFHSDFLSSYGTSEHWDAPGEGIVWNQWFDKDTQYDTADALSPSARRAIQGFVGQIERMNGTPFVNKNLRHDNRIGALAQLFPTAIFLIVLREPQFTAASILRARLDILRDADAWFSIKPKSYERIRGLSPPAQIAGQLKGLYDDLASDIVRIGVERFVTIDYGEFCANPSACMADLHAFYLSHGVNLVRRHPLPSSFQSSKGKSKTDGDGIWDNLRKDIATFFPGQWLPELACSRLGSGKIDRHF